MNSLSFLYQIIMQLNYLILVKNFKAVLFLFNNRDGYTTVKGLNIKKLRTGFQKEKNVQREKKKSACDLAC